MESNVIKQTVIPRINIRLSVTTSKALKYARIETGKSNEQIVEESLKKHLLELGTLKESGELNKPEPITIPEE